MKLRQILTFLLSFFSVGSFAQITLEECLSKAETNYPLIRKYDLISQTRSVSLEEINKQWLPGVNVYVQGNVQNVVSEFPLALTGIMSQMGQEMPGLSRWQYKIGADVTQTIWDGGAAAAQRRTATADSRESDAALAVNIYAVREKVMSLFFGALLTQEQIRQQQLSIDLLKANLQKLKVMVREGTAMQSDADNIEAQILSATQKLTEASGALKSCLQLLGIYVGEDVTGRELVKPVKALPESLTVNRPELTLFDARAALNNALRNEIYSGLRPKIGAFIQAFYGYPGFNNFEAMMNRKPSFNILGGVKLQWNLNPFYKKKTSLQKIDIADRNIAAERETFIFNTSLQSASQSLEIVNLEEVMQSDARIVELRAAVRKAAEAQLDNGVIDTVALLSKITDENQARLNADYHEIKLLQTIYQLKYTLNR